MGASAAIPFTRSQVLTIRNFGKVAIMSEGDDSVRPEEQESQDSPRKMVAEVVDGGYYRIKLTHEEHVKCTTDPDFLKILLKATFANGLQPSTSETDVKNIDTSNGNVVQGKWPDPKIKLLLTLVAEFTPHTKDQIERKAAWEIISKRLEEQGYSETYFGVSKKWANLKDRYKIVIERVAKGGVDCVSWPYFETIDKILGWRNKKTQKENLRQSVENSFPSTSRTKNAADSDSGVPKEKRIKRKGTKRKCGQIAGRSQKRYLRKKKNNNTEPTLSAPGWLTAYLGERHKEEERWLQEFANNMSERNEAILSLAATIAEFSK